MAQAKKAIKISCNGETKRLKIADNYNELISRTSEAFQMNGSDLKFFYLDDENEVISITS